MNKKKLFFGIIVLLIIIVVLLIIFFNNQKNSDSLDSIPVITKAPPGAQVVDIPDGFFDNNSDLDSEMGFNNSLPNY